MTQEEFLIELAEAQITGFTIARFFSGEITHLISEMALNKKEWNEIQKRDVVMCYLNESDISEIEEYFNIKK